MNKAFFDALRSPVFDGKMSAGQVDGINIILNAWNERITGDASDDFKLGYVLGTAKWETNHTMQPVVENLNYTSAKRIKEVWPSRFKTVQDALPYVRAPAKLANRVYANRNGNGNEASGDGYRYRGRGDVQLTGKANYAKAGKKLGFDLVANPDLASDPAISAQILIRGMEEGWFTGKNLGDYVNASGADYEGARRVVNGNDEAEAIAKIATGFYRAIEAARKFGDTQYTHSEPTPKPIPAEPIRDPAPAPAKPNSAGWFVLIITAIAAAVVTGWEHVWTFITGIFS